MVKLSISFTGKGIFVRMSCKFWVHNLVLVCSRMRIPPIENECSGEAF